MWGSHPPGSPSHHEQTLLVHCLAREVLTTGVDSGQMLLNVTSFKETKHERPQDPF